MVLVGKVVVTIIVVGLDNRAGKDVCPEETEEGRDVITEAGRELVLTGLTSIVV